MNKFLLIKKNIIFQLKGLVTLLQKKSFLFTLIIMSFYTSKLSASLPLETDTIKPKSKFLQSLNKPFSFNYLSFSQLYPIRDNPIVGYRSSFNCKEKILFDVHPVLSLSFYNDFKYKLSQSKLFSQGYSFLFRPQFRLYDGLSTPVKMPSYQISFGLQHLYRLSQNHLLAYSLESGHYSNGQSGSALIGGGLDGTAQSDSVWALITPDTNLSEVINRTNGDFSTNYSELIVNYRFIPKLDSQNKPKQIHSFSTGVILYHYRLLGIVEAGGYSEAAIKIYGKWRYLFSYDYNFNFKAGYRFHVSESLEIIQGAHPSVNPVRSVFQFTFFLPQSIGVFANYIYGHDDYNLRFVDSGHQFGVGFTWDIFPPIQIGRAKE